MSRRNPVGPQWRLEYERATQTFRPILRVAMPNVVELLGLAWPCLARHRFGGPDTQAVAGVVHAAGSALPSGTSSTPAVVGELRTVHSPTLSERRAHSVRRAVLGQQRVLADRVRALGKGEREPLIAAAAGEDDHRVNRRVEVGVLCSGLADGSP